MFCKKNFRIEKDLLGEIHVSKDCYWGAQTQRALEHFSNGSHLMPSSIIRAFGIIKKSAALVNAELGLLAKDKTQWIVRAAEGVIAGKYSDQFPLQVFQSGSGTQTNMNVNEVIANLAIEFAGGKRGDKDPVHPNDHVNMSQSSNDTFPTAMHVAAAEQITHRLLPSLSYMKETLEKKSREFAGVIKIGRTHLMDAVPLSLGQELSAYVRQLEENIERIQSTLPHLFALALGGTAVGTGLNAPADFAVKVAKYIAEETRLPFVSAPNKFAGIAAHDAVVFASCALKTLSVSLIKIANDFRWMGSGPRCGLYELFLPANEPGSSIMPGKVNPTQCEAMTMAAVHVMGNDVTISIAGSQGNFELNVFKPVMIYNLLDSISLLSDVCTNFTKFLLEEVQPNYKKIERYVSHSLMLVTVLSPKIGYDKAAQVARFALTEECSLKEACIQLGFFDAQSFDALVQPEKMI